MKNLSFFLLFLFCDLSAQSRFQDPATGKWGYQDQEWNIIAPAIYDEVQPNFDTIMAVKKDGKMGAIDEKGRYRIPLIYEQIMPNFNSFPTQYGYAAVTKNTKMPDTWCMVDARGKVILPEKFYYVRALTPQLLVGRVSTDTFLQFYDPKGRLLYKIKGRHVEPNDLGNTCFFVKGLDRRLRAYKTDGTPVYPPNPEAGVWTDGAVTILTKGMGKKGVINSKGDTIIPFEYVQFKPGLPGQFIVAKANDDYTVTTIGVYDKKGKIILPFADQSVIAFGKVYQVYEHNIDRAGIFSADGAAIVPKEYRFSSVYISEREYSTKTPDRHPERYVSATHPDTRQQFLIRDDGTIIRPKGAQEVRYHGDNFPLIIEMAPEDGTSFPRRMAIDLNGKVLLPAEYLMLDFTPDPNVLIGRKATAKQIGFIPLDAPQKAEFVYDYQSRFSNGCFRMQTGHKYDLYNLRLKRIHSGEYNWCNEPNRDQYLQFRLEGKTKEKLVATAFREGMAYGEWLGITESGQQFLFKKVEMKAEQPPVKVEEAVVMEEATDAVEAPPSPPAVESADQVFQMFDVQEPPAFPGGEDSLKQYLARNLQYPRLAAENGIQGMVAVKFIVEKNGALSNINVVRDIGAGCGNETIRLVETMPKWTPAKRSGQFVRVEYTLPVRFKLE